MERGWRHQCFGNKLCGAVVTSSKPENYLWAEGLKQTAESIRVSRTLPSLEHKNTTKDEVRFGSGR